MSTIRVFNFHIRTPFLLILIAEYAFLFFSLYVALFLRFQVVDWQPSSESLQDFPTKALVFATAMMLGLLSMGQYQNPNPKGNYFLPYVFVRITISLIIGSLILLVVYYVLPTTLIGRGIFAYAVGVSIIFISLFRTILYRLLDGRIFRKKILVLGAGDLAASLISKEHSPKKGRNQVKKVLAPSYASYVIHGFVNIDSKEHSVPEKYLVNPGDSLVDYCEEYEIDEIVLAISDRRKVMPVEALLDCKLSNITVLDFLAFWEKEKGMLKLDMLNPSWFIFCEQCEQGALEMALTRAFDILASFFILALTLPVLVITALLIFIENKFKGPVFYRQQRVGLNGEPFELLKFRSMVENAESDGEAKWASENDMRVTKIGNFIRKCRIDEIPQVINIFRGDMSLVGPRPERPEFVEKLNQKIPYYSIRHRVKPGLAGWAQLKYPYGASEEDSYQKLQYDLFYLKNHSILMDILILLQTVEVILLGKGAR